MKILNIIFMLLLAPSGFCDTENRPQMNVSSDKSAIPSEFQNMKPEDKVKELPTELLEFLKETDGSKPIDGITPEMCEKEIKNRQEGIAPEISTPISPEMLSFEILNAIANSARSVAGINAQEAFDEQMARMRAYPTEYIGILMNELAFKAMTEKALKKWDEGEMVESVEAFMKDLEEAKGSDLSAHNTLELLKEGAKKYTQANSLGDKLDRARRGDVDAPIYIDVSEQIKTSEAELETRKEKLKERGAIKEEEKSKNFIDAIVNYLNK